MWPFLRIFIPIASGIALGLVIIYPLFSFLLSAFLIYLSVKNNFGSIFYKTLNFAIMAASILFLILQTASSDSIKLG